MELYQQILRHLLKDETLSEGLIQQMLSPQEMVEMTCYQSLKKIREIIQDDSLDDPACFYKIEKIVSLLEDLGSDGGFRHDFSG